MGKTIRIGPQKGPQEMFLATSADICIYGGAAGGGKTFGLLLDPLRYINDKVLLDMPIYFERLGNAHNWRVICVGSCKRWV